MIVRMACLVAASLACGCATRSGPISSPVGAAIDASASSIESHASAAIGHLRADTPDVVAAEASVQSVLDEARSLGRVADDVRSIESELAKLKDHEREEHRQAVAGLYDQLGLFFAAGFVSVIIGIFVFTYNRKAGLMVIISGVMALALAAGAIYYLQAVAIVGISIIGVSIVFALGAVGYYLWRARKTEENLVRTTEAAKAIYTTDDQILKFKEAANVIQDPKTQKRVWELKSNIR